ncbi:MAG: 3-deoxy-7-phosphoheptulonate synthase [Leptolyngbya sp. PLA2]|nr:3-deoxy-7-phosphoheptulonate synthase [Leptolyngbya sp.]MCE7971000.1 3-deoxy-7-phosphoheptulonate synthase [Leptolyngbya sp. PL-A2]MCZ7631929.1 3-deoxy-7-phosphoheptulonate synthase [Phycisphaerales bacterium]GIK20266.1 MAG: phospho-2-dehydro-3-deoxyheptonate aldolase [Planctomycetota bacterium]
MTPTEQPWTPDSWRSRPAQHGFDYPDAGALEAAITKLRSLPPLVTSFEIERLKALLAEAQEGRRFLLQGGDCAETLADCRPETITSKLKILLQMSLVLVHGLNKPVIRVGRFAGQYAKPRSSPTESRDGPNGPRTLPSYFGDLINAADFDERARTPDPHLMVRGYQHAAMTLNFIRSLLEGGFADVHHPEYWDLSFLHHADLPPERKADYERVSASLAQALKFMEALGEARIEELTRVEFYTSHEGLNLLYESAQTRRVPRRTGWYDLTTHMPWIGDRTRALGGAHVEFFRGVANPVAVKLGHGTRPGDAVAIARALNPADEPGKLALITRMGAHRVRETLPPILDAVRREGVRVLWVCDPMHGNTTTTSTGVKTRSFDAIAEELERTIDAHRDAGTMLGGVHFELTGEDVTECLGGAAGVTEEALTRNYASPCDPRLNYQQSLELAFRLRARLAGT